MFHDNVIKILNDDETIIFKEFLDKYYVNDLVSKNKKIPILYMPNITINMESLLSCKNIYFINKHKPTTTIFEFLQTHYICYFSHWYYDYDKCSNTIIPKYKWIMMTISDNTKYIHKKTKQKLQDIFTILYYIFTKHNNVYLPELSKYIFLMYFDVIYD